MEFDRSESGLGYTNPISLCNQSNVLRGYTNPAKVCYRAAVDSGRRDRFRWRAGKRKRPPRGSRATKPRAAVESSQGEDHESPDPGCAIQIIARDGPDRQRFGTPMPGLPDADGTPRRPAAQSIRLGVRELLDRVARRAVAG